MKYSSYYGLLTVNIKNDDVARISIILITVFWIIIPERLLIVGLILLPSTGLMALFFFLVHFR